MPAPPLARSYAWSAGTLQTEGAGPVVLAPKAKAVATIAGGEYPDGIAFDPEVGKLYVSDESGGTDTLIDTASNQVVATIPPGGEVGNTQFDATEHQIIAAMQTRNQVVTVDPETDQVTGRYATPGCDHPHGVQISPDRRLAFVACENNAKLVVMDLRSMSVTQIFEVGAVPDVLAFDAPRRALYVAAESGPATAFSETDTGLKLLAQQDVGPNAHSIAVDPDTGHVYFPIGNVNGRPMLREVSPTTATGDNAD